MITSFKADSIFYTAAGSIMSDNIKTGKIANVDIIGADWVEISGTHGTLYKTGAYTSCGLHPAIRITNIGGESKVVLGDYIGNKMSSDSMDLLTTGAGIGSSRGSDIKFQLGQSIDSILMTSARSVLWHYVIDDDVNFTKKSGLILAAWHHNASGSLSYNEIIYVGSNAYVGDGIIDSEITIKVQEGISGGLGIVTGQ